MKNWIHSQQFLIQEETEASPTKSKNSVLDKHLMFLQSQLTTQPQSAIHSKKFSQTQHQIYSHETILKIMNKRDKHTVRHMINQFQPEIILYAKPRNPQQNSSMFKFSNQNSMYKSEYSKKMTDVNKKLNKRQSLSSRIKNRKQKNESKLLGESKRPQSANIKTKQQRQDTHKKITVSGLVSYNFNSVNARKNLGFDFERDDDKLNAILSKLQNKSQCCGQRQNSILQKRDYLKFKQIQEVKQAVFVDLQAKTSQFLQNLNDQIKEDELIYGVKWAKMLCIKQLMQQQKIGYVEAQQIVNQIEEKKKKVMKKEIKKLQVDQQYELNNRKKVYQKNKVILKHLYFADT